LKRRAEELAAAARESGSAVLRIEWLDALIDAGDFQAALPEVDKELSECRLRSAWLIRRARCLLAAKNISAAQADLREALAELNTRIAADNPDAALLLSRAHAFALLGNKQPAEQTLRAAAQAGAEPFELARVTKLVARQD
jgi:hypothetical protein